MDQKKSGLFIRDLRKEKGMSQKQFAAILNVSESAVCKWEKGVNLPDTLNLQTISDMFQITVNELLAGERMPVPELKLKLESEPDPSLKLTSELEANSGEYEEMNPVPEQKPESGLMPTTDSTVSDNQSKTRALRWKRRLALCSLCISVLTVIVCIAWHQVIATSQINIVKSYQGPADEFYAASYGFEQVYWVLAEFKENTTTETIQSFTKEYAHKLDAEGKTESIDAICYKFYENYSEDTVCSKEFTIFLPLIE